MYNARSVTNIMAKICLTWLISDQATRHPHIICQKECITESQIFHEFVFVCQIQRIKNLASIFFFCKLIRFLFSVVFQILCKIINPELFWIFYRNVMPLMHVTKPLISLKYSYSQLLHISVIKRVSKISRTNVL